MFENNFNGKVVNEKPTKPANPDYTKIFSAKMLRRIATALSLFVTTMVANPSHAQEKEGGDFFNTSSTASTPNMPKGDFKMSIEEIPGALNFNKDASTNVITGNDENISDNSNTNNPASTGGFFEKENKNNGNSKNSTIGNIK